LEEKYEKNNQNKAYTQYMLYTGNNITLLIWQAPFALQSALVMTRSIYRKYRYVIFCQRQFTV